MKPPEMPTNARADIGRRAESRAAQMLAAKGYRILARNFRCRRGEIDLVALDHDILVFVEVRCRTNRLDSAVESISVHKMRRLVMAARAYLAAHPSNAVCRFDVVCIAGDPDHPTKTVHMPAAFTLDDA